MKYMTVAQAWSCILQFLNQPHIYKITTRETVYNKQCSLQLIEIQWKDLKATGIGVSEEDAEEAARRRLSTCMLQYYDTIEAILNDK